MKTTIYFIALLTFVSFQLFAQHALIGTWEYKNDSVRSVKIITPTHWMVFTESHNRHGGEFIRAHGGTYSLAGNKYVEKIETASFEDFGEEKTDFTFEIEENKFYQTGTLTLADGTVVPINEVWQKVNNENTYDNNPSVGTWEQLFSSYTMPNGTKDSHTKATASRFQIITSTHWMRISHREGKFENFVGGSYNIDGDKIYPIIEFSSHPALKNNEVVVDQKVDGDKMYWNGYATNVKDKGTLTFEDVFQKVENIGNEIIVPISPYPISEDNFSVSTIAEGFSIPYGIAIIEDNEYFITDRIGKMFHFKDGNLTEINGVPAVAVVKLGEVMLLGGLMDLSIHPDYSNNSWVYMAYVSRDCLGKVARCKIQNDSISQFEIIFTTQNQNIFGNGMRMVWEDDTHFFLNVGSTNFSTNTHPILTSQDLHSEAGKIHRLMEDGSIPSDNPTFDGFTSPSTIWSYGHRDVQGLHYNKIENELIGVEHGPKGGDELNVIKKGGNYGWPLFSYGTHYYNGEFVSTISEDSAATFTTLPEYYWTVPTKDGGRSIGPACLLKVEGSNISDWNNYFLFGSLPFRRLMKYDRNSNETYGLNIEGRVRTIKQLPSGDIIALIERSNTGKSNGKIIRISY